MYLPRTPSRDEVYFYIMPIPTASPSAPGTLSDGTCLGDASLETLLAIAEKKYHIEFVPISAGGVTLEIAQIKNMREILDTVIQSKGLNNALATLPLWAKIWPASLILGHYLRHVNPKKHTGLLEIGAGCGVTGLVAAALGFSPVCITDINEDALLFAQINVLKNSLQDRVTVRHADVRGGRLGSRYSCIVGAEILYLEHLYGPLVKFLTRHLAPAGEAAPHPEIILATDHRREAKHFFKLAAQHYQVAHKQIGATEKDAEDKAERHLLTLHRLSPLV